MLTLALSLVVLVPPAEPPAGEGAVAEQSLHLAVGERREVPLAHLSRVAVGQPGVMEVTPLRKDQGVVLKGLADGVSTVLLFVQQRPVLRLAVSVGAASPAQETLVSEPASDAGARVVDNPDCTGARASAEVKALGEAGKALQQAHKYSEAITKFEQALALDPAAANLTLALASTQAKDSKVEAAARNYEAFARACPKSPEAPKAWAVVQQYRKAMGR